MLMYSKYQLLEDFYSNEILTGDLYLYLYLYFYSSMDFGQCIKLKMRTSITTLKKVLEPEVQT